MASSRLAYAIFCAGALLWVYTLTVLIFYSLRKILPERGKTVALLFLTSFILSTYVLLTGLLNPILIAGTWFIIIFVCPLCAGSGLFEEADTVDIGDILPHVLMEATVLAVLIIAISLIREPIGLGSLSLPGGISGIVEFFGDEQGNNFFPIRFFSIAAGGFITLGFVSAVFRHYRNLHSGTGGDL
jgi:hypothetical protein